MIKEVESLDDEQGKGLSKEQFEELVKNTNILFRYVLVEQQIKFELIKFELKSY
jgi:hypothetical protein